MPPSPMNTTLAIIGGTGKQGKGLAYRWARAGYRVIIASRMEDRAKVTALELLTALNKQARIESANYTDAVQSADIAILTVPFAAHRETLLMVKDALQGKLLVDVTVPLDPPKITTVQMPSTGSAAQEARDLLGESALIASAFQNISYEILMSEDPVDCDVLVTGVSMQVREDVLQLVKDAGLMGWDAGSIENSAVAEGLTSVLIYINKKYNARHAGIKITGAGH